MTTLVEAPPSTTPAAAPRWRWSPAALTAVVIAPIVVAIARAVHQRWFPISDSALLYLRARDVFTPNHPLLGSWTSVSLSIGHNVNNPGALYSDLVAPFSRIFNGGAGAAIGVGAINIAAVVGISIASHHVGGWRLQRVMLAVAAAMVWTMGSWLLVDIWQPHALLLPFLLLLVLLLGIATNHWRCVPWLVAVGSLVVQTHIAYAYAMAVLGAAAVAISTARRRTLRGLPWRRTLRGRRTMWCVGIFLVLWSQPFVEQLFGRGEGNLSSLASGASGGGLKVGARDATRLTAAVLLQWPWRLRSGFTTAVPRTPLTQTASGPTLVISGIHVIAIAAAIVFIAVAALIALAVAHGGDGDVVLAAACWLAASGLIGGVICISLVTVGPVGLAQHHVRWLWPMTIFAQAVGGWALVELVGRRMRARDHRVSRPGLMATAFPVVVACTFAIVSLPAFAQAEGPTADQAAMTALRQVYGQLGVLRSSAPVVFDLTNQRIYEPYSSSVMLQLQQLGIAFHVSDPIAQRQLGDGRRATGRERTTIFQLEALDAVLYDGPACRIAAGSALSPDAAAAAAAQSAGIAARLASGQIEIDATQLTADDAATYRTALAADSTSASRIVDDGTLARWVADGIASINDDDRAALVRIGRWVSTAYALYAVDPATCPSATA